MGLLRNLQVRRKGTHPKEVPWENVEERASRILVGRQWYLRFLSSPRSSQRGPQGFQGEELLSPGRTAVKPKVSS